MVVCIRDLQRVGSNARGRSNAENPRPRHRRFRAATDDTVDRIDEVVRCAAAQGFPIRPPDDRTHRNEHGRRCRPGPHDADDVPGPWRARRVDDVGAGILVALTAAIGAVRRAEDRPSIHDGHRSRSIEPSDRVRTGTDRTHPRRDRHRRRRRNHRRPPNTERPRCRPRPGIPRRSSDTHRRVCNGTGPLRPIEGESSAGSTARDVHQTS